MKVTEGEGLAGSDSERTLEVYRAEKRRHRLLSVLFVILIHTAQYFGKEA
ncbi:hypothetical protein KZ483_08610 [Paenibacillus sp. sptzw28]|nr:hypothetical protein [Paenibacillus sp. sptzw28]QYR22973.1 hypothetical protein KZ483_08610 [Paenibacillus sp. sptzw28]